jgi:hypothetical protein
MKDNIKEYVHFYNSERRHTRIGDITPKEKYLAENKPTKINYNYIRFCPNKGEYLKVIKKIK